MGWLSSSERVMWGVLFVSALAGAVMIGYQTVNDWHSLPESEQRPVIERSEAKRLAQTFLEGHFSLDTGAYQSTQVLTAAVLPDVFLDRAGLTTEEIASYRVDYLSSPIAYSVRFFIPQEIEEYEVLLDAYTGTIIGFKQVLPEDESIPDVPEDESLASAKAFVATWRGIEPEDLRQHSKREERLDDGLVRHISFAWEGTGVESEYGTGFVLFNVEMRSNTVSALSGSYHFPESYERFIDSTSNVGLMIGALSLLAWGFMLVAAFVVTIKAFMAKQAVWKFSLVATVAIGILLVADMVNSYPVLLAEYSTIDATGVFWMFMSIGMGFALLVFAAGFFIPSTAGHTLANVHAPDRFAPLHSLPSTVELRTAYRHSFARGYLLGIALLGLTYALFWLGERYFDVWYLGADTLLFESLSSIMPALTLMVSIGVIAALLEELTFRLFGILWLSKLTKSTLIGVIVATIIWAFAHTDGMVMPLWFRGVEVLIGGILLAYFFIRYNVLTVIVAHYVHNILIAATVLIFMFGTAQMVPAVLIIIAPLLLYAVVELLTPERGDIDRTKHAEPTAI